MGASDYVLGLRGRIGHDLLQLPGVCVVVVRPGEAGREVLLVKSVHDGGWMPVCGGVEPGEDVDQAAVRECHEETGVEIAIDRVTWLETLAPTTYPNGDQCEFHDVALLAHPVGGDARVGDEENVAVGWFSEHALPRMGERYRRKIAHALTGDERVRIGAEGR